jgi:HK97 family phage major capsid protein
MEKLMTMFAAMVTCLALPVAEREGKLADVLKDAKAFLGSDEAKGLKGLDAAVLSELKGTVDTLKLANDKTAEQLRDLAKIGISAREFGGDSSRLILGRQARLDMLADRRAFQSDETAKRFGAHVLAILSRAKNCPWNYEDLPQYTRDLADSVKKDAEAFASKMTAGQKADANLNPTVTGAGAELVSNEFRAELIRNVEALGTAFVLARSVPLATMGDTTWPTRTSGLTAAPAAVAAQLVQSGVGFGTATLRPVKWATLTGIPGEMYRDPGQLVQIGQLMGVEISEAFADAFDNAFINGDGTATYGGITGALQSATILATAPTADHDAMSELTAFDTSEIIGGLTAGYALANARWLMSLSVKQVFRGIRQTDANGNGQPIFDRGVAGVEPASIDGYPYTLSTRMPASSTVAAGGKFALFGDFKRAFLWGMMRSIQIDTSAEVWFSQDLVAVRGLVHVDMDEVDSNSVIAAALHS